MDSGRIRLPMRIRNRKLLFESNTKHNSLLKSNNKTKFFKKIFKFYEQVEAYGHKGKLLFWFVSFCSESEFSLHPCVSNCPYKRSF